MEHNHGLAESAFTGHIQAQRGQLERWAFTMEIARLNRLQAAEARGFFLRLEGRLGTFLMHDPAAPRPLGRATGKPVVAANTPAASRTVATTGWSSGTPHILRAGDWVQIGDQLSMVRQDVHSGANGAATLDLWPKLMLPVTSGTPIITRPARGIFRFTTDFPSWQIDAALKRPFTTRLTGQQEILLPE
jgi:hypothetical protein